MALILCPECSRSVSDKAPTCPHCGAPVAAVQPPQPAQAAAEPGSQPSAYWKATHGDHEPTTRATKKRKSEFAGTGCLIQLIGLVLLFLWPLGTLIGIGLLIYGSAKSIKLVCSSCGNTIEKTSTLCPHCKASFG